MSFLLEIEVIIKTSTRNVIANPNRRPYISDFIRTLLQNTWKTLNCYISSVITFEYIRDFYEIARFKSNFSL